MNCILLSCRLRLVLLSLAACTAAKGEPVGDTETADTAAPEISHTPIEDGQILGEDVELRCTATDEGSGVFMVLVMYQMETSAFWERRILVAVEDPDTYAGVIPGVDVEGASLFYYLSATDGAGNTSTSPEEGEDGPYPVRMDAL